LAGLITWEKMAMKAIKALACKPVPVAWFFRTRLPPNTRMQATTKTPEASENAGA
jgi:hypothetical protein